MFRYAVKRLIRGRGLFLSLFLSVALAATLFSGILQGADAIGARSIDQIFNSAPYDIISTAPDKNISKTRVFDIAEIIGDIDGVIGVDHFVRWPINLNSDALNETLEGVYLIAIPDDSVFYEGLTLDRLERGVLYIDVNSGEADTLVEEGSVVITANTYLWKNPPGFETKNITYPVEGSVGLKDKTWALFVNRYNIYLQNLMSRNEVTMRRPIYNMVLVSEETFMDILNPIFAENRRPVDDQEAVALITLDRETLVNPWDIPSSKAAVNEILEEVNANGARYMYLPRNFLGELLDAIRGNSDEMKTSTMVISIPVFFTAWYLGVTVSEVVFGLRRREIGLLFTRGMNHKQVLYILLFEGAMVSVLASVVGIIASTLILPIVIPGVTPIDLMLSITPTTLIVTFVFSTFLAVLSVYRPAQKAININIVDAIREHQTSEEEGEFSWLEPMTAFVLGAYRMGMLFMGVSVDQFRPESSNLIVTLLYSTWWGTDYLLSFIAPILFFWGFIKLFVQYVPWYQTFLTKIAQLVAGDAAKFLTLSSRRNLKRVAASMFMTALIVGYSVSIIGNIATSEDFLVSAVKTGVGADIGVWLFEGKTANEISEEIKALPGVASATIETILQPKTSLGNVPIRGIDPIEWRDTAYIGPEFVEDLKVFEVMNRTEYGGLLERGAANALGYSVNNTFLIQVKARTYSIKIVGFFGRDTGDIVGISNPVLYVNDDLMEKIKERYIDQRRIILKVEPGVDLDELKSSIEEIDPDIQRVDVTEHNMEVALSNVLLSGPKQIQTLGAYFAGIVASIGVMLITSTVIRSRMKELTIMAIRGYSQSQMAASLLLESIGMDIFAIILGLFIGLGNLIGVINLLNSSLPFTFSHRVVFPTSTLIQLGGIIVLLLVSTIIPTLVAVRQISVAPDLRLEE
ncbi:MAG: ABC transporter permease [Candidatus Bathyarchaeota archaeon]|nr:ABC transporter permease [Candidatus Bathyarchaeota archaeon]